MMRRLPPLSFLLFTALSFTSTVLAQPATPLTLDRIMADPDWIGPPVEDAWWSWDGRHAQYNLKREGTTIRDTFQQSIDGGVAIKIDGAARATLDAADPVYDAQHARMAFVRNGDVFVRDLRSGRLEQVTRSNNEEARPQWSGDGGLVWRVGNDWYRWSAGGGVAQAAIVKAEDDPAGLQDHLLIAHGMIDDNVFYKDSVMLAQKLIELRKDDWELASYPLERHAFTHPDSWYDEYRRILELFNAELKP